MGKHITNATNKVLVALGGLVPADQRKVLDGVRSLLHADSPTPEKTDTLEMLPVLTLDMLQAAVKNARRWLLDARLSKKQIESLPDGLLYPIVRVQPARGGVSLCVRTGDGKELTFDAPVQFFDDAYFISLKNNALQKLV